MTPDLSPSELATVARFEAAPSPFCDCCSGAGQVRAVPVGASDGALIVCPLCAGTGEPPTRTVEKVTARSLRRTS